jgi:hypothetical protein
VFGKKRDRSETQNRAFLSSVTFCHTQFYKTPFVARGFFVHFTYP